MFYVNFLYILYLSIKLLNNISFIYISGGSSVSSCDRRRVFGGTRGRVVLDGTVQRSLGRS